MTKAVYPGTFDPITLGHLDVIARASRMFDEVIVAVGNNPAKSPLFTLRERMELIRNEVATMKNVQVKSFQGLVINFARTEGVSVMLRGIRTVSDLEYEVQMAFTNRASGGVETLFIAPSPRFAYINARFIKEIAMGGGDVSELVSPAVARRLKERLAPKARAGGRGGRK